MLTIIIIAVLAVALYTKFATPATFKRLQLHEHEALLLSFLIMVIVIAAACATPFFLGQIVSHQYASSEEQPLIPISEGLYLISGTHLGGEPMLLFFVEENGYQVLTEVELKKSTITEISDTQPRVITLRQAPDNNTLRHFVLYNDPTQYHFYLPPGSITEINQ